MADILLPELGEGITSVEISEVLVKKGDTVKVDDPIIVVETEKASMEIPSSESGKIIKMKVALGDNIAQGSVILMMEVSADSTDNTKPEATSTSTKPAKKEITLNEDGSNLITVLYNIILKEGRIPEDILNPLSMIFPNTRISFQLTDDGRALMKVFEEGVELSPPSISDGFYKILLILTAIYLKPSILIIDEIENSLYPEALELIFDTLKESESQVIITTHSPIVVDLTEPKDVMFVDKKFGESRFIRIKNPEKLKEKLNELGLSFSEGWLYGNIFDEDEENEEE